MNDQNKVQLSVSFSFTLHENRFPINLSGQSVFEENVYFGFSNTIRFTQSAYTAFQLRHSSSGVDGLTEVLLVSIKLAVPILVKSSSIATLPPKFVASFFLSISFNSDYFMRNDFSPCVTSGLMDFDLQYIRIIVRRRKQYISHPCFMPHECSAGKCQSAVCVHFCFKCSTFSLLKGQHFGGDLSRLQ